MTSLKDFFFQKQRKNESDECLASGKKIKSNRNGGLETASA